MLSNLALPMASFLLFLSLFIVTFLHPSSAGEPIYNICRTARNFTGSSPFDRNLRALLGELSSSTPATGFAMNTSGESPDIAYGLALCRDDVSDANCRSCLANASSDATRLCPGNKEAFVYYDLCQIRYSDRDFFGSTTGPHFYRPNAGNISDATALNPLLGALLNNLTLRAASSPRLFAADSVDFNDFKRLYALVQCTRDLSSRACEDCLRTHISDIPRCCADRDGGEVRGGSCFLRYSVDPFFGSPVAVGSPPPTIPTAERKENTVAIAVGVSIPFSAAALAVIGIWAWRKRRTKLYARHREGEDFTSGDSFQFSSEALKLATGNFSDQNKLGEGGFGVVYKGVLPDGKLVAVKRLLSDNDERGELKNEVVLVGNLQHRNLVRLLGYCWQDQDKILVYEYLARKSLDKFLFDPVKSKALTWETRAKIVQGIARGLVYLHEDSRLKIIHRDLKASNILLDDDMNPKIADFGLAKLFGNDQSFAKTQHVAGTYGYMAPEYMMHGQISAKSDVYSFGVLLLEIISGKKCVGYHGSNPPTDLINYIWRLWNTGNPAEVLDKDIVQQSAIEEVLRWIHVGLLCVQRDPLLRPTMSLVVLFLRSNSISLPVVRDLTSISETCMSSSAL